MRSGFTLNPARDGKYRKLTIKINRPGMKLEYRPGYYAPADFKHSGREDRERDLEEQLTSAALTSASGSVVAYQADLIDHAEHLGWSVTVVGVAHRVIDPDEAAAYRLALRPWVTGTKDQVLAIHADLVTGFRLVPDQ